MLIGMYLLERAIEDAGDAQQIVVINDLQGFDKSHNDFRMNKLILEMVLAHYPNRIGAIWCTSTPWLFRMIFRVIKPWLGDELISRVHLFGGTSELKEHVDADSLLPELGGNLNSFSIENWAQERAKIENVKLDKPTTHQFNNEEIVAAFSDAPVSHTAESSTHQGWLKKQGGFVKKFNKRYCVLKGTILYYYRTQSDNKADGVVFLRNSKLVTSNDTTFHIITSAGKDCIFQLADKKNTQWLKILEDVILSNGGSIGKSGNDDSTISDPIQSFGISWSTTAQSSKKSKSSSSSASSEWLNEKEFNLFYNLFNDSHLLNFPDGHVPGNEIIETMMKYDSSLSRSDCLKIGSNWIDQYILFPLSPKSKQFSDSSNENFIFTFTSPSNTLNSIKILKEPSTKSPEEILQSLHENLKEIIQNHLKSNSNSFDYKKLRSSKEYLQFLVQTADLQLISFDQVKEKKSFFFNLRSLLLLHSQAHFGIPKNCDQRFKLFNCYQYIVGMQRFSLTDIGHGILRANSSAPESLLSQHFYDKKDPRIKFCLKSSDERIVFALFLGITLDTFHVCIFFLILFFFLFLTLFFSSLVLY